MHPWVFSMQAVPLTKQHRRGSCSMLFKTIHKAVTADKVIPEVPYSMVEGNAGVAHVKVRPPLPPPLLYLPPSLPAVHPQPPTCSCVAAGSRAFTHDPHARLQVGASASRETETRSAVSSAYKAAMARLGGSSPSLVISAFTCTHDAATVGTALHELMPANVPLAGMTTCRGVVCNGQVQTFVCARLCARNFARTCPRLTCLQVQVRLDSAPY